jgi:hypothetical protein
MIDTRFKGAHRRVILNTRHLHAFRLLYATLRITFLVAEYFLYVFKYIKAIFEVITSCRIYELYCLFKLSCPFFFRTNQNIKIFLIFPETSNVKCTGRFKGTGVDVVDVV